MNDHWQLFRVMQLALSIAGGFVAIAGTGMVRDFVFAHMQGIHDAREIRVKRWFFGAIMAMFGLWPIFAYTRRLLDNLVFVVTPPNAAEGAVTIALFYLGLASLFGVASGKPTKTVQVFAIILIGSAVAVVVGGHA